MKTKNLMKNGILLTLLLFFVWSIHAQNIIDHTCTDVTVIPGAWIDSAQAKLHIGYGHTSHGSQIASGMASYDNYHGDNTFDFSSTGGADVLHLFEGSGYDAGGELIYDLSHEDDWYPSVVSYLESNSECNVIMYSWCNIYGHGIERYIDSLESLIGQYGPGGTNPRAATTPVTFVFMTGHSNSGSTNEWTYNANMQIRQHCIDNNRVLLDFYDIECWDPDGNYFGDASTTSTTYTGDNDLGDDTSYDLPGGGRGNWGNEWLAANPTHYLTNVTGSCSYCSHSDHSQLQCVLKGGAAWYLWARLAGWDGPANEPPTIPQNLSADVLSSSEVQLTWEPSEDNTGVSGYNIYRDNSLLTSTTDTFYLDNGLTASTEYDYEVTAYDAADNESDRSNMETVTTLANNTDCHGDVGGSAYIDNCGTCVGGNTGESACTQDCNGDWGGTAFTDNCSNCVGGATGNSACAQDCNGDWGGSAYTDNCSNCVGGTTGQTACTQDCNGDWGGTAYTDNCSNCVGGNTGQTACVPNAISNGDNKTIAVFPNPVTHELTIQSVSENQISGITITNIAGAVIYKMNQINSESCEINTNEWNKGNYYIQIQMDNKITYTSKIIK